MTLYERRIYDVQKSEAKNKIFQFKSKEQKKIWQLWTQLCDRDIYVCGVLRV